MSQWNDQYEEIMAIAEPLINSGGKRSIEACTYQGQWFVRDLESGELWAVCPDPIQPHTWVFTGIDIEIPNPRWHFKLSGVEF